MKKGSFFVRSFAFITTILTPRQISIFTYQKKKILSFAKSIFISPTSFLSSKKKKKKLSVYDEMRVEEKKFVGSLLQVPPFFAKLQDSRLS